MAMTEITVRVGQELTKEQLAEINEGAKYPITYDPECPPSTDRALAEFAAKGQTGRKLHIMIVGIPNVGKSTFINKIAGRKAAEASDRPGVTRQNQWVKLDSFLDLLDTPGILWPKFDSQLVGENLACTGAVKDDILDYVALAANLMVRLREKYPERLTERYKFVPDPEASGYELLEAGAKKRGFLISGGEYDLERMAAVLLDEFRGGKLGRISLEKPGETEPSPLG